MGKPPTSQPPGRRTAITMGDPRGIGPEVMPQAVQAVLAGTSPESLLLQGPDGVDPGLVPFEGVGPWDGTEAGAGRVTLAAIQKGVELALEGSVGALVTGPSHKPALRAAGWRGPGQTELLGELSGAGEVGMLMCAETTALGGALRVLHRRQMRSYRKNIFSNQPATNRYSRDHLRSCRQSLSKFRDFLFRLILCFCYIRDIRHRHRYTS